MTRFAGLDVASTRLDLAIVTPDGGDARWHTIRLATRAWDSARNMRELLPGASWWEDHGIACLAIERPMGFRHSIVYAQALVIGALLARLPAGLTVIDYPPARWRTLVGLPGNASKLAVQAWALEHGADREWDSHACDALAVAWAAINDADHWAKKAAA